MARSAAVARRSSELSWLVTGPLALISIVLTSVIAARVETPIGSWGLGLVFLALFIAADVATLVFQVHRNAIVASLSEIPLVLGLAFLPPVTLIVVRVLAKALIQAHRRVPPVKAAFNVASVAANVTAAELVVTPVIPDDPVARSVWLVQPTTWLLLAGAVFLSVLVSLAAVTGVIALVQGRVWTKQLANTAIAGFGVASINVVIGIVVLILMQQNPWAILLVLALAFGFVLAYRSYANFMRQHSSLAEIYDVTRAVADTPHDGTLTDVLLGKVRALLKAEYATLWVPAQGRYPELLLSAKEDALGLIDLVGTPDILRQQVMESGETIAVGEAFGDSEHLAELRATGVKDAIVVPLRAGSAVIGTLEVAGRIGDLGKFGPTEVKLLEAIAAHAAVAVENSRLVDRLRYDAYHDALTGLPNRRRVTTALEESVKVRAPGEVVAVLFFDVDSLRDVNDSLGYAAGDRLIGEVATRLRSAAAAGALVGRVGGDEFVVTLRIPSAEAATSLATSLRKQLQQPLSFGTLTLDVDTAVGIVVHPDHGTDPATLLQRAELATHAAKSSANGVQLFSLGMESRSVRRLGLAGDLRRALDNNELEVYFQPKVDLRDRHLVGVECLARWEHPTHGSVAPEDFVAVAEHTGQLSRLTEAVLREGLRRAREWIDAGRPLGVAVNLSARTLLDTEFPNRVDEILREYAVSPDRLTLEITEDGFVGEEDRPLPTLRRLYELGVRLSVDDFGTGYSSLSYLRRLPVHEVKIDRSFVQGMATDAGDLAIVRAVVDISRHFGLAVVAEGVESELTLDLLAEIGCDIGQGFLFSRPLPYERLEAWLGARTDGEPTPGGEVRRLRAVG
ncbi:diguanylate cyclase (GGDEF)-like protein [Hamadaea flava]|uniref:Bifunctional diguanylate cyclase/phosphodiesterase n=1 Tax=Hamadaea flava TaxID=1742688 RepID=A0ABV8LHW7_9ACTN|nr:GGDEF and EAL domain-containing protein [Hamadaea flava]MCP2325642.1 diguanylate cyclase (GGDEF)-like protein [Hamadaea flava]